MNLIAQTMPNIKDVNLGSLKAPGAFAPNLTNPTSASSVNSLSQFISTFIGFLTTLAGLMFLIYFIVAGLAWITAGGEKGKVESARQQMTNAALGLIIVIAAYSIVGIVGGVVGINILNPVQVIQTLIPKVSPAPVVIP